MINFKKLNRCLVVAEISANHGQSLRRALSMIKKAKACGVDAVKFQVYTPDTITLDSNNRYFRIKHPKWKGQTLYQLYEKAYTPWKWFKKLKEASAEEGLLFFATAFDTSSVDFLEELDVPLHKISSFELVDLPLMEYVAKTKKPLIMSTGMASKKEIKEAVDTARKAGANDIMLLKCVSTYPADPAEMNLKTILDMKRSFKCPVGISDHSTSIGSSVAAVSLGAAMVEKHFTLSRKLKTPDSFFSTEPNELCELVKCIRTAESAMGRVSYNLTNKEKKSRVFRRSLFAAKDIKKGEMLTKENIRSIRPGYGLSPKHLNAVIGKKAKKNIKKATPLTRELFI